MGTATRLQVFGYAKQLREVGETDFLSSLLCISVESKQVDVLSKMVKLNEVSFGKCGIGCIDGTVEILFYE